MVGKVKILMHTAVDLTADYERQRSFRNRAILR